MDTYVVHNPEDLDLEFEGELLVEHQSADLGNVKVYRTQTGTFVAEQLRPTFRDRRGIERAAAFPSLSELAVWLGHSRDAKAILDQVGHPVRKRID